MAANVRLPFNQLDERVRRTPVVLLEVSELTGRTFPEAVPELFEALYGEAFASVALAVWEVPHRQWLVERLSPARPDGVTPLAGLYLFLGGRASRYHTGYQRAAGVELFDFDASRQQESDAHAREILDLFLPAARAFLAPRTPASHATSQAPQAHPIPFELSYEDACRLLGVSGHEALDVIEKAARSKQILNHPDRVASLDPELGRVASERFLAMGRALEVILRNRRR
jgi:hypothetical protein